MYDSPSYSYRDKAKIPKLMAKQKVCQSDKGDFVIPRWFSVGRFDYNGAEISHDLL